MDNITKLEARVTPKSSRNEIQIDDSGIARIYISSPPVEGKANSECIKLLSKKLRIPKKNIKLSHGLKGRNKIFLIEGITSEELKKKLSQ